MNEPLSSNTQAILLLTAPLIVGRSARADELKPGEYSGLNSYLRSINKEPADLMEPGSEDLLDKCIQVINKPAFNRERLQRLLSRGFLLSQAVESWRNRAIWVVSHRDEAYPQRLRDRLKEKAPAVLYGCGDHTLLNAGGLAVVGSRHVDEDILEYTNQIGNLAASAGRTIVSGGARGVDRAAMNGALEAGGKSIGVLANGLRGAATNRAHRDPILNEQLVLISPYDPSSGFNVGHAMQRNKLIYALADAALVVNAEKNKGGTWNGAIEQLNKLHLTPLYIRSTGAQSAGLDALKQKGALPWPNPGNADDFREILDAESETPNQQSQDETLFDSAPTMTQNTVKSETESKPPKAVEEAIRDNEDSKLKPADELFRAARESILRIVQSPKSRDEIKAKLGITQTQANHCLKQLVDEGVVKKINRPVRYLARQKGLFGEENSL